VKDEMIRRLVLMAMLTGFCGCANTPTAPVVNIPPGKISVLPAADLRDVLADLANAHNDKIELSFWVSTPLRPVDDPFRPFFQHMGTQNKQLLGRQGFLWASPKADGRSAGERNSSRRSGGF
jgi:hypothetical protein